MFRHLPALLAGAFLLAGTATAQQLPSNASVQGTYNFRYLGANATSNDVALSFQGTITFDGKTDANGNGTFTVSGQGAGATAGPAANNIYGVFSSGLLYMNNPFDSTGNTFLYGGVGSGAIVASSTDTFYCDLLVAIPVATSASTATLNGKYWLASLDFLGGNFNQTRDTFFSATANGSGSFGDVTIKGYAQNVSPPNAQTQTSTAVAYTVSANGSGTLNFPAPNGVAATSQLLSGNKVLYVSQDGNFFVAGGTSGYDIIVGVKAISGDASSSANGLYFAGYLENFFSADGTFTVYSADGAANEIPSLGVEIGHQRTQPDFTNAYDDSYGVDFKPAADGTVTYTGSSYVVGGGGNFIIGAGAGRNYQLTVYTKAPSLSGTGVFLNPQGIVNAANNVPFTAGVSPGEFVSLFGTGMSSQTTSASALPFPTTLGGVQVTISWFDSTGKAQSVQAPLSYVSPTLINLVVPYTTPGDGSVMTFKVTNNNTASNVGAVYSGPTSPGIFTVPSGGIGNGAILHADFSLVSPSSPAKVGETVQIFLTGLGAVTPPVAAGAAGPSNPLSTTIVPDVYIDGVFATTVFSGLAPTLGGLYQLNVTDSGGDCDRRGGHLRQPGQPAVR
jgi:uncharacterized protein (TIGR03437 family)